jgi:hypothetical protein
MSRRRERQLRRSSYEYSNYIYSFHFLLLVDI